MRSANPERPYGVAAACGGAVLLACLGVVYATPNDAYWIVDCAGKGMLAEQLLRSGYRDLRLPYPAASLDPEGVAFPLPPPFAVAQAGGFVWQYPPAFSGLAAPFLAILGRAGLRWPAALGTGACAALFVLWTAPAWGRRWAALGGLALAFATPLFFYGVTVWEHSLTIALSLGAWVVLAGGGRRRRALAGLLVAAACVLRAELALMGVALAFAVFLEHRRWGDVAWLAAGAAPLALALLFFNQLVFGHPLGPHVALNVGVTEATASGGLGVVVHRVSGLLAGMGAGRGEALALGGGVAACVALAVLSARRPGGSAAWLGLAAGIGLGASLFGLVRIGSAPVPLIWLPSYNGLLVQLPLSALAGFGAIAVFRRPEGAPLRVGVSAGLGFLALGIAFRVTLTDFATGGHWGPRMLLPAAPALVALSLGAVRARWVEGPRSARWAAALGALALVAAGATSSGLGVRLLGDQKREGRRIQQAVLAAPQTVLVTNLPALGWLLAPIWEQRRLLYFGDTSAFERLTGILRRAGVREFLLLHSPPRGRDIGPVGAAVCRRTATYRGRQVRVLFDFDQQVCTVTPPRRR
jgi:hypothetical protein